jgi:hypothetical protein
VEIDSREILKVRNWKRECQNKQIWRRHLKEVEALLSGFRAIEKGGGEEEV